MGTPKKLHILGIRGIPAEHGGFETFAEKLSLHLKENNWLVTVYCQETGTGAVYETDWNRIRRVHIPVKQQGALGTVIFDFRSVVHSLKERGLFLTLGYNTALFNVLQRIKGHTNIINMDGIEWKRAKWGKLAKLWFWANERIGCWVGNHLIADHPLIKEHLATRVSSAKITMIPYGGDEVKNAHQDVLNPYGLLPGNFSVVIARPEPENSLLEIVKAFSRTRRNHQLVVLGNLTADTNEYHKKIMTSASDEVVFTGAIYDATVVQALRFHSRFYIHGHQVGGTNPSLVEAMGAGCAVIAHRNDFNKWVANKSAAYFKDEDECSALFDTYLDRASDSAVLSKKRESTKCFQENFTWGNILFQYEELLTHWYPLELKATLNTSQQSTEIANPSPD